VRLKPLVSSEGSVGWHRIFCKKIFGDFCRCIFGHPSGITVRKWVPFLGGKLPGIGRGLLWVTPFLMKTLSTVGTVAMFLVGGQILVRGIPVGPHWIEGVSYDMGAVLETIVPILFAGVFGVLAGAIVLPVLHPIKKLVGKKH